MSTGENVARQMINDSILFRVENVACVIYGIPCIVYGETWIVFVDRVRCIVYCASCTVYRGSWIIERRSWIVETQDLASLQCLQRSQHLQRIQPLQSLQRGNEDRRIISFFFASWGQGERGKMRRWDKERGQPNDLTEYAEDKERFLFFIINLFYSATSALTACKKISWHFPAIF